LDKLLKDFNQPEHPSSNPPSRSILPSTSTNTYDLTKILSKKKSKTTVTIPELQSEIKTLKSKLKTLKQAQQKDSAILQHLLSKIESQSDIESESEDQTIGSHALPHTLTNIEHIPDDFLNVLTQISSKKYLVKITLIFSEDFKLDNIALFDIGADLNCFKEGVVPKCFYKILLKNSLLLIIQNYILQEKPKPLFSTTTFLLKYFLSLQKILIIPSFLALHSLT